MFIIIPIIIFITYQTIIGNTNLKVLSSPKQVYISINNKDKKIITSGQIIKLNAGTYNIKITKDNFQPYTEKVNIIKNKTNTFVVVLTGLTNSAKKEVKSDLTTEILESWDGKNFSNYNKAIEKNYPIIKILPINNNWYSVALCKSQKYPNDQLKKAVCIKYYKESAIKIAQQYIKSRGYNLDNYEVIYKQIISD